jgi:hypothetical protein
MTQSLLDRIAPKPEDSTECSPSSNLLANLFNAISCIKTGLDTIVTGIQGVTPPNIDSVILVLANLQNVAKPPPEDNPPDDQPTEKPTEDPTTTEEPTATTASCTSSTTEELYIDCLITAAPGRAAQRASSCTTATRTGTGCDLSAITTTAYTAASACPLPTSER